MKCEDCEEYKAEYQCVDCQLKLCEDCSHDDHPCFDAVVDEYKEKLHGQMFKKIKKQKKAKKL